MLKQGKTWDGEDENTDINFLNSLFLKNNRLQLKTHQELNYSNRIQEFFCLFVVTKSSLCFTGVGCEVVISQKVPQDKTSGN